MTLPLANHPLRLNLNAEAHARPPAPIGSPSRLSFLALYCSPGEQHAIWERVVELAQLLDAPPPPPGAHHYFANFRLFHLAWEQHTEFARFLFWLDGAGNSDYSDTAIEAVPRQWLSRLPGTVITALNALVVPTPLTAIDHEALSRQYFDGHALVGATISTDAATALTDFQIYADGSSRLLVLDHGMTPVHTGRVVQRLFEIDVYRMMSLMALPVARALGPQLSQQEGELTDIIARLTEARDVDSEFALLDRLTQLAAKINKSESDQQFRFAASRAYYALVIQRIADLREQKLSGLQTFAGFNQRRLSPAMNTCEAISTRQTKLADRVARTTQLLSSRVDMNQERQSQLLLQAMNRRASMQLRLQGTVEGLSIAAISYYMVGLFSYFAYALEGAGVPVEPKIVVGFSVPLLVLLVAWGVRRVRKSLILRGHDDAD